MKNFQISSTDTDRNITRTAVAFFKVLGCLLPGVLWIWAIVTAPHADGWNTVVLEYLAFSLGLLTLLFIPLRFKFNRAKIAQIYANAGCWLLIIPLIVGLILYCIHLWNIWRTFTDGNDYFDPLVFILNYLTPLACFGVGSLFFLWRNGFGKKHSFISSTILLTVLTLTSCAYGIWLFHGEHAPWRLSYFVWWFEPFRVFGL